MEWSSYTAMILGGVFTAAGVVAYRVLASRWPGARGRAAGALAVIALAGTGLVVAAVARRPRPSLADDQPLGMSSSSPSIVRQETPDGMTTFRAPGAELPFVSAGTLPFPYVRDHSESLCADGLRQMGADVSPAGFVDAPLPFAPSSRGVAWTLPDRSGFSWLVPRPPDATTMIQCILAGSGDARVACEPILSTLQLETPFVPRYEAAR